MAVLTSSASVPPYKKLPLPLSGIGTHTTAGTLALLSHMGVTNDRGVSVLQSTPPLVQYLPDTYYGITSLWAGDAIVAMRGVTLLYNGSAVGTLSYSQKQFALLGKKLIIFPDRVYLDLSENPPALHDLGPDVPAMDFITVAGNRLLGCSSTAGMIYVSAAGDPTTFTVPTTVTAASPWRAAVTSPGAFTACATVGSSVLFFKNEAIIKLLGSAATGSGAFALYEYSAPGVAAGAGASVSVTGSTVYYAGQQGLWRYSGSNPERIDRVLIGISPVAGFAGKAGIIADGQYLIAGQGSDEARHLLSYNPETGAFSRRDGENVTSFVKLNGQCLPLMRGADGYVYTAGSGDGSFFAQWNISFDTAKLKQPRLYGVDLHVAGTVGTALSLSYRRGDTWVTSASQTLAGTSAGLFFPIPPADARATAIRLCGTGQATYCAAYLKVL